MAVVSKPNLSEDEVARRLGLDRDPWFLHRITIETFEDGPKFLELCQRCHKTFRFRWRGDGAVYWDHANNLRLCNVCLTRVEWRRVRLQLMSPEGPIARNLFPVVVGLITVTFIAFLVVSLMANK
jgi:hypothetical protein